MKTFNANDAKEAMTGLNEEQAVHWARRANQLLKELATRYKQPERMVLINEVVRRTSEEMQRLWNQR